MVAAATEAPIYNLSECPGGHIFQDNPRYGADLLATYKSEKMPNGNFAIRGIDIFAATRRYNKATGKWDNFDDAWLADAERHFNEEAATGYYPPVHIGHHGKGPTRFAGTLRNVRRETKGGKPLLFADIVDMPPAVFADVAANRIPYRSVEINNPDARKLSSLALLDTTPPYHKFRLLHVDQPETVQFDDDAPHPVHFAGRDGSGVYVIGQTFEAPYAAIDEPTRGKQIFMNGKQQQFQPGEQPEQEDDAADPFAGMSDEEIAELAAMLEGDPEGMGQDPGYDDEMAELAAEGIGEDGMGQLLDAIQGLSAKVESLTQATNANGASGTPQPPSPVLLDETGNPKNPNNATPSGDPSKPITQQQMEILLARMDKQDAAINRVVQFMEQRETQDYLDAIETLTEQHFQETIKPYEDEHGPLDPETYSKAIKGAFNAVNSELQGVQFSEDKIDDIRDRVKSASSGAASEFAGLYWGANGRKGAPAAGGNDGRPPRANTIQSPTSGDVAGAQKFCESNELGGYFTENPDQTSRLFSEADSDWNAMSPAERKEFGGNRDRYIKGRIYAGV